MIVLSPHCDDAVWSASALLESATVVTICAGIPPEGTPPTPFDRRAGFTSGAQAMRVRREEDREAAQFGGFEVEHLDWLDCGYAPDEPLEDVVAAICREAKGERILGPLGLRHPDHIRIGKALPDSAWRYEEIPYAYMGHSPNGTAEEFPGASWKRAAVYCYRSQINPSTHLKEILHMPERFYR
jgi:LmbE family N-acetylglucosaminyl deacetylase